MMFADSGLSWERIKQPYKVVQHGRESPSRQAGNQHSGPMNHAIYTKSIQYIKLLRYSAPVHIC